MSGRGMNNIELVGQLCSASVALREARRVHLRNFGVLVPHVFMTEVLARVGFCISPDRGEEGAASHRDEAGHILEVLERGLQEGERETRNVIALSFVNDSELERFFGELRPMLGPLLQGQLRGR